MKDEYNYTLPLSKTKQTQHETYREKLQKMNKEALLSEYNKLRLKINPKANPEKSIGLNDAHKETKKEKTIFTKEDDLIIFNSGLPIKEIAKKTQKTVSEVRNRIKELQEELGHELNNKEKKADKRLKNAN